MTRSQIDLCGAWWFQPDPAGEGIQAGYFRPDYDIRRWREVSLPASFEACMPALDTYEGEGWFRRTVAVPAEWQGRRVMLRFHGVNYHASVWVNGQLVGENSDGFLPFEFAIQDVLDWEHDNLITVRADNIRRQGEAPGLQRGWRTFGGILREVELVATDLLYLDRVRIVAEPTDCSKPAGANVQMTVRFQVENERAQDAEVTMAVHLIKDEELLFSTLCQPETCPGNQSLSRFTRGEFQGIKLWSPDAPNLYTVQVELWNDRRQVDTQTFRVGFRRIETRGDRLYLNDQPIFLTGFNRHEDSPRQAMAPDLDTVRRDLLDMKAAGANFVRLCHYPHHPGELDLCDELGLVAMGEVPLYWWDGLAEGAENYDLKFSAALRQLKAMINRDAHHPSLIFWSVSNETDESRPEVVTGNAKLIQLVRSHDPTRLAVHVSNHWQEALRPDDIQFAFDDVICVNAYPSLERRGYGGQSGYDLAQSTAFWREGLAKLHQKYPQKPILVTEFGYASLEGVFNNAFGEDAQAAAIAHEFAGMDASYVCGATVWCWADHPWPPATFEFCRYLGASPYGVVTRERRKLQAYWTIKKMFRERQAANGAAKVVEPPPPFVLQEGPAGYSVAMIRPHMRDIPQVPFPPGFGIRPMRLDEGSLWTDIERDAEPFYTINDEVFQSEFGYDPQAILRRCYIVTDERGLGVGTISAWYNRDFKGQDYGRIHWVAIRRAYWGHGLGKAELSFAMNQLAQWHERAYLDTQTKRIPAINMYLNFGFVPDLDPPGAAEAWRSVLAQLKHPTLEQMLK